MYAPSSGNPTGRHPEKASWLLFRVQQRAAFLPRGGKLHGLFSPLRMLCAPKGGSRKAPCSFCTKASEMGVTRKTTARVWAQPTLPLMAPSVKQRSSCRPSVPHHRPQPRAGQPPAATFPLVQWSGKKWQSAVILCLYIQKGDWGLSGILI